MSTYIIKIEWLNTKEWIFFDPENLAVAGDIIETTETWYEPAELVRYQVKVLDVSVKNSTYVLGLEYSEERNEVLRGRGVAWGVSEITIHLGAKPTASAIWSNTIPDAYFDGEALSVSMSEQTLTEDLGYVATQAKKRKQAKFRAELESRSLKCEISGESEPNVLQAAHIVEVGSCGGYGRSNGLLIRSDIHTLFDRGLLNISEQGKITLSDSISAQSKYWVEAKVWKITENTMREVVDAIRIRNTARDGEPKN